MNRIQSTFASLFLTGLALALACIVIEATARIALNRVASKAQFDRYASLVQLQERYGDGDSAFVPHPYLMFVPRSGHVRGANRHNALGFRGADIDFVKAAGEFRIVAMGASTTYSSAVADYRSSYPARLESVLRETERSVTVVNSGVPDWTTWETLISFETRVLDLDPDLVIVHHAINDLEMRVVWPPERYRGDNSGSREALVTGIKMPSLFEYSTAIRFLMIRMGWSTPHAAVDRLFRRSQHSLLPEWRAQQRAGTYPAPPFIERPVEEILAANPPVYFRRNLTNLIALARANGVEIALATMAVAPARLTLPFASAEDIAGIQEMNAVTRQVAERTGVSIIDFAKADLEDGWFVDGVHLNEEGIEFKAQVFARALEAAGLIPSP